MTACKHPRAQRTTITRGYRGPISSARRPNPIAHGGVCLVETCGRCGAEREANTNGGRVEQGMWQRAGSDA